MSQKRLIDSLCRLGCCYYQVQQICCRQIRLEIVNCPVPQDARSCSYLLSCQHLPLERFRINGCQHTAKSASSFQEEMAHLPAATTATSTPTTPEHTNDGRRLRAHAVELCLGESSISLQNIRPDASRSPNFPIRRTRECCASKFVREEEAKDAATEQPRGLLRYGVVSVRLITEALSFLLPLYTA